MYAWATERTGDRCRVVLGGAGSTEVLATIGSATTTDTTETEARCSTEGPEMTVWPEAAPTTVSSVARGQTSPTGGAGTTTALPRSGATANEGHRLADP